MVFEQLQIIVFRNALRRNQFSANICILLWINNKIWNSGAQRKNGCIHPQQDSYELSFRCILRYCPHPPLVFPLIICIYDSLYLTISCNYKCFSSLWFSVDKFICGMKLKIIFFGPWKCKVIFPEYWLSSPLSDGKVQVVCKNRERSFMGF